MVCSLAGLISMALVGMMLLLVFEIPTRTADFRVQRTVGPSQRMEMKLKMVSRRKIFSSAVHQRPPREFSLLGPISKKERLQTD